MKADKEKIFNERVKVIVAVWNAVGVGVMLTGFRTGNVKAVLASGAVALALHVCSLYLLGMLRREP